MMCLLFCLINPFRNELITVKTEGRLSAKLPRSPRTSLAAGLCIPRNAGSATGGTSADSCGCFQHGCKLPRPQSPFWRQGLEGAERLAGSTPRWRWKPWSGWAFAVACPCSWLLFLHSHQLSLSLYLGWAYVSPLLEHLCSPLSYCAPHSASAVFKALPAVILFSAWPVSPSGTWHCPLLGSTPAPGRANVSRSEVLSTVVE